VRPSTPAAPSGPPATADGRRDDVEAGVLVDVSDLDDLLPVLPPTALGEALRRARRERDRPPATGAKYQRAME
jgi:hypothetical protein